MTVDEFARKVTELTPTLFRIYPYYKYVRTDVEADGARCWVYSDGKEELIPVRVCVGNVVSPDAENGNEEPVTLKVYLPSDFERTTVQYMWESDFWTIYAQTTDYVRAVMADDGFDGRIDSYLSSKPYERTPAEGVKLRYSDHGVFADTMTESGVNCAPCDIEITFDENGEPMVVGFRYGSNQGIYISWLITDDGYELIQNYWSEFN